MELVRRPGTAHGVVAPVRRDPAGVSGPTKHQATRGDWRRSSVGLYVPARVPLTPEQRIVEAAALVPRYGAITGWAALRWEGARWLSGTGADGATHAVPLAMSRHSRRPQQLVDLCEERFDPREVVRVDGVAITTSARSVCFAMRYAAALAEAVVALEMAAFADLVTVEEARSYAAAHPSYTGIERCRRACLLADENSWSPQETRMRMIWELEAGLPRPLTNRPVFDATGRHIGTPDLIDPVAGVVGEYDGETHLTLRSRRLDLAKEADYRAHGLEVVRMVAGDRSEFVRRLRDSYARSRHPVGPRTWTLDLPHWWRPTATVEQRRSLSDLERQIWLAHRAA